MGCGGARVARVLGVVCRGQGRVPGAEGSIAGWRGGHGGGGG